MGEMFGDALHGFLGVVGFGGLDAVAGQGGCAVNSRRVEGTHEG